MRMVGSGVELRHFESEDEFFDNKKIEHTDICKQYECSEWTRFTQSYFLWADQTVSHLGSDGIRTDFLLQLLARNTGTI